MMLFLFIFFSFNFLYNSLKCFSFSDICCVPKERLVDNSSSLINTPSTFGLPFFFFFLSPPTSWQRHRLWSVDEEKNRKEKKRPLLNRLWPASGYSLLLLAIRKKKRNWASKRLPDACA